jgi:acid phosphatase type 7
MANRYVLKVLLLVIILFVKVPLFNQAEAQIFYLEWGPGDNPNTTMTVNWVTSSSSSGSFEYRQGTSGSWSPVSSGNISTVSIDHSSDYRHRVRLTGLSAGTSYQFRVNSGSAHRFRTPPSSTSSNNPLNFVVGGDIYREDAHDAYIETNKSAAALSPYFAVLGGDLVHDALRGSDTDFSLWRTFLQGWYDHMITPDGYLIPIIGVIGNHEVPNDFDHDYDDAVFYRNLFSFPGQQGYEAIDFGSYLSILALNTGHTAPISGAQTNWLDSNLQSRQNVPHVFPVYHVAAWPSTFPLDASRNGGSEVRDNWSPLFENHGIEYAFEHHNHSFHRTNPILNEQVNSSGVTYIGGGGWGANLRDHADSKALVDDGRMEQSVNQHSFVYVALAGNNRSIESYDLYGEELRNIWEVTPSVRSASGVQNTRFTARWESVSGVSEYYLDVSRNSSFTSILSSYNNRNVGNVTEINVTGLNPGTTYYYRIRGEDTVFATNTSGTREVTTTMDAPTLLAATDITDDGFTINWEPVDGASRYRLDIARDDDFNDLVSGYDNENVGNTISYEVSGLTANQTYYFRVRAQTSDYTSSNSDTRSVRIVQADPALSSIAASVTRTQAYGSGSSTITVVVVDPDENELEGRRVRLLAVSGNLEVDDNDIITDSNGQAVFTVQNSAAETTTYGARTGTVELDGTVDVTYLPIDPDESFMTLSTEKVLANGQAEAEITVTVRDEDENPFENLDIELEADGGSSSISDVQSETDSDGTAVFRVSNNTAETITYSAIGQNITISETVTVNFVTVDADQSTISVSPEAVEADGQQASTIIVTARDEDGDILEGATVNLDQGDGNSTINTVRDITNSSGEAEFEVSSSLPEIVEYRVIAEDVELADQAVVQFIPVAPVALSATDVQTREFVSNWEMVSGADTYLLDVSTDSSFSTFVNEYEALDVGEVTSHTVDGLSPGTDYTYRVRVQSSGLIGANSQTIQTTTYPDAPVAAEASERNALRFTANWEPAEGARNYRLDVAKDPDFQNLVYPYEDLDVGDVDSYSVTGLEPGTAYHYRVRSEAGPRTSANSNGIATSTLTISGDQSDVTSAQLRVLANGNQANEITIVVRSDEGILLEGLPVNLQPESGSSQIQEIQSETDEDGKAVFAVTNTTAEKVNYSVLAASVPVGEIEVEFLQDQGVLDLGDNFPNPFNGHTFIPLSVPRAMNINLTIYDALGQPVYRLRNEEMQTGYYEIRFSGADLAAGVYFYRLVTEEGIETGNMVLVR